MNLWDPELESRLSAATRDVDDRLREMARSLGVPRDRVLMRVAGETVVLGWSVTARVVPRENGRQDFAFSIGLGG